MKSNVLSLGTKFLIWSINTSAGDWAMRVRSDNQQLLAGSSSTLFRPVLRDTPVEMRVAEITETPTELSIQFSSPEIHEAVLRIWTVEQDDAIDLQISFVAKNATQLNRLELFPAGTGINLYDVANFRNRHHTSATWPELPLGGHGCKTDTFSTDWQFAPHPTAWVMRKFDKNLFFGAMDISRAYGMYLEAADYRVKSWYLNYGVAPHGLPLAAGEKFISPRFRFFLRKGQDVYQTYQEFGSMLIKNGRIPDPALKQRHSWWREPLYCTWIDQGFGSKCRPPAELKDQSEAAAAPAFRMLTSQLVMDAVQVIKREKLPIRTILIDEGWNVARGQWEPHPQRFANFRGMVDELHADGFKVVVWWNWAELENQVQVNPKYLIDGGKLNRHGRRMRDYSLAATQDDYLKPLFRRFFSHEADCYNLDGIKTDFLADKVHPELPPRDPAWRGEENYFLRLTEMFYGLMRQHKADAVHIGCAGHYWLANCIDINRTYDVACTDPMEHQERARMLMATTPGCPVAYDFHNDVEHLPDWFASAETMGASVQIGNVLWVKDDVLSEPRPADAAFYATLLRGLRANREALGLH